MTEAFIYGSYGPDNSTNRVVNVKKNAEMWNAVFREHLYLGIPQGKKGED